jgi:hypothetical protein
MTSSTLENMIASHVGAITSIHHLVNQNSRFYIIYPSNFLLKALGQDAHKIHLRHRFSD